MKSRLSALVLLLPLLLLLQGCPTFKKLVMHLDLKALTGEIRVVDLRSDSPDTTDSMRTLMNDFVNGTSLEKDHPGWTISSKTLEEVEGRLDGVIRFTFLSPADAGVYKHDKKSPYIYCATDDLSNAVKDGNTGDIKMESGGKLIGKVLKNCVAWDKKAKSLDLTLIAPEGMDQPSLLQSWKDSDKGTKLDKLPDTSPVMPGGGPDMGTATGAEGAMGQGALLDLLGGVGADAGGLMDVLAPSAEPEPEKKDSDKVKK